MGLPFQVSDVDILIVPYDSAIRAMRMGAGPSAIIELGLVDRLQRASVDPRIVEIEPRCPFRAEIATAFELHDSVRRAAREAIGNGRIPLTLSGNCNTGVVGSLAAHDAEDVGLFWFDAHSDAETPETSTSGFFDGMGFAVALGECWRPKLEELGWSGIDGRRAVLIGAREISSPARDLLQHCGVIIVPPETVRAEAVAAALDDAFDRLKAAGVRRVHVHVDLDVLDPELVGVANCYALPGGVTQEQLVAMLRAILREFKLASASVAAYDPSFDEEGNVARAGLEVLVELAGGRSELH